MFSCWLLAREYLSAQNAITTALRRPPDTNWVSPQAEGASWAENKRESRKEERVKAFAVYHRHVGATLQQLRVP